MSSDKKGNIEKYGAILGVISLILSVATVPTAVYFAWRADYLSQINSNFDSKIIPLSNSVTTNTLAWYYPNGTYISSGTLLSGASPNTPTPCVAGGILNISLIVITPHVSVLNLSDAINIRNNFIVISQSEFTRSPLGNNSTFWLESTLLNENNIFNPPSDTTFDYFIQEGITKIDFSMPIQANFYVNPNYVNNLNGFLIGGDKLSMNNLHGNFRSIAGWNNVLGSVNISVKLQDLQTGYVQTYTIPVEIQIPIYVGRY
jgi:hypothetical protein